MHFAAALPNALAPLAVAGLWQGFAIVVAVALCLQCARRMPARQRFALWGVGFLAAVVLPLAPLFFPLMGQHAASAVGSTTTHSWLQLSTHWASAIAALWLIASLARAIDLVLHVVRLARLWRNAIPIEPAASAGSARGFELCRTEFLDRPSVIGFFRPRVLIPDWLLPKLTTEELEQIVLHETTHLARRDDWTNLFQKLCLVAFPLSPGLWWIDRQLAREREMACDEEVVRATQAPRAYAACLASLAEHGLMRRREALSLGAWHRRSELVNRVHSILRARRSLSPATAGILLGAFACGLVGVSIELARCPQLVAFVPAPRSIQKAQAQSDTSTQLGDVVFPTNPRRDVLTPGVHIVQARAEMPGAPLAKPLAHPAAAQTHAVGELRASSEPIISKQPRQPMMAKQFGDSSSQFILFTTWERIETVPAEADYEISSADSSQTDSNASESNTAQNDKLVATAAQHPTQKQPQRRTTFTQLILRITPSNSPSSAPTAVPIGGGWFVIQL